jgi:DNA modification methylase
MNLTTLHGDCITELCRLPAGSVHCVITSPPYWGLRSYPIPSSIWGGKPNCKHAWGAMERGKRKDILPEDVSICTTAVGVNEKQGGTNNGGHFCNKCGAWRGQLGLEPSPELYVEHMLEIFAEVWRVLRPDGTCWVNLGDCYHTGNSGAGRQGTLNAQRVGRTHTQPNLKAGLQIKGRKPGDLIGIPWMVAFAMQAQGWWLRKDNIWHKPNCMPESLGGHRWMRCRKKTGTKVARAKKPSGWDTNPDTDHRTDKSGRFDENQQEATWEECPGCPKCAANDGLVLRRGAWRPTTAHEHFFQFSKAENYFCDSEAVQEPVSGTAHSRGHGQNPKAEAAGPKARLTPRANADFTKHLTGMCGTRNMRSVWRINPKPYKGSHTATFPPELIRPIVRAATSPWVCDKCGGPHAPVVELGKPNREHQRASGGDASGEYDGENTKDRSDGSQDASAVKARILEGMVERKVTGYRPTCKCAAGRRRAVVLDIFGGTGTTGKVAIEEGRDAILIEIGDEYLVQVRTRTTNLQPKLL